MGKRDEAKGEKIKKEIKEKNQIKEIKEEKKKIKEKKEEKGKKEEKEICHSQTYASSRVPCLNQEFLWCFFSQLKGPTWVLGALVEGEETARGCSGGLEEEFICFV